MTEAYVPFGSQTIAPRTLSPIAALLGLGQLSLSSSPKRPADGAISPVFQLGSQQGSFHCPEPGIINTLNIRNIKCSKIHLKHRLGKL